MTNVENKQKKSTVGTLLTYAGKYRALTFIGCGLSAIAMLLGMVPYVCIWLVIRDLIEVAPNWSEAEGVSGYGWLAFGAAFAGIAIYFAALLCTHLAAFRTAENIRKEGMAHLMKVPIGYFDNNASGLIRNRLDGAAGDTEQLLAHNLADIVGTIAMIIGMLAIMIVFDWRMGVACLVAAVISVLSMFAMMGGKNAGLMKEYQEAQDRMSKAGTEYVRGIPVVKVFQQTIDSFKAFRDAIDDYSSKAKYYQGKVCKVPQAVNLTFTEGAFVFLIPLVIIIAPAANASGNLALFITNFAFYAIFSAIISTSLAKIMFAGSGMMLASAALERLDSIISAPIMETCAGPKTPVSNEVVFQNVSFTYPGANRPAIDCISFTALPGETMALVGPSGGGKTTCASLIPRFWDVDEGEVTIGGVDVRDIDQKVLMDRIAFVFQNEHLFKRSIFDNVRASRPEATEEEVKLALEAAQCNDIIEKLPNGINTVIGSKGTYLSGGEVQRIAMARFMLKDAPIIVLDEATAFADPENEVLIQKAFGTLTKDKTVIMIAHRLSTVVNADRIIVLDGGHVVESGSHKDLVNAGGLYQNMWNEYNMSVNWKIKKEAV